MVTQSTRVIGFLTSMSCSRMDGRVYVHASLGRVLDRLADRFEKVYLCCPVFDDFSEERHDHELKSDHIGAIALPAYVSTLSSLRHPIGIVTAYIRLCRCSSDIVVRGIVPYALVFYLLAWFFKCTPCIWVVGNSLALLRTHRRAGWLHDRLSIVYAVQERLVTRFGRWLTSGSFLCNGRELANIYKSPRTHEIVSSTISEQEFFQRNDTCTGETIRILFVGFIRPEKGLEYLIQAVAQLRIDRPWELLVVGSCEQFTSYKEKLLDMATRLGQADRIRWIGYVTGGSRLYAYLRTCDVLVLPTLSEGTPRVLVEARANSIPIIASRVGGIPTSVRDGIDGVLVSPKDSRAIVDALHKIVADRAFRQSLIVNGLSSARKFTVDAFVSRVEQVLLNHL